MPAVKGLKPQILALLDECISYVDIADRLGCSRENVAAIARRRGRSAVTERSLRRQARLDRARELLADGQTVTEVARTLRMRWGDVAALRDPTPYVPSRRSLRPKRTTFVRVPAWAASVHEDYRDFARDFDEDYAARECRKLLREERVAERMAA